MTKELVNDFSYIRGYYKLNVEIGDEVMLDGKRKGVVVCSLNQYLGVNFYDTKPNVVLPVHPTWNLELLGTKAEPRKITQGQKRYAEYKSCDTEMKFMDWLKCYKK